LVKITARG